MSMGTNCAPPVADLMLLVLFEIVFMLSLSDNKEGDVIEEINSILRHVLDGYLSICFLNIDNPYLKQMTSRHISQELK